MERILLVEDDAQITASLSAFLQSEGFSVETATGETQARQLVEQTAPGLLLVDVQLAEGSGFGVCAYARSRGLPVIFLTASGDESSVVLGLDMGADDYIAKPFRPRELVSRIRSVLRRYGKEKTLVPLGGVDGGYGEGAGHTGRPGCVSLGAGIPAAAGVSEPPGKGPLPVAAAGGDLGRRRGFRQ